MIKYFLVILLFFYGNVFAQEPQSQKTDIFNGFLSNLFVSKGSELTTIVDEMKFVEADAYFAKEREYFRENKTDNLVTLKKLADGMASIWVPMIDSAAAKISSSQNVTSENWSEAKASLAAGFALKSEVNKIEIFKEPGFEQKSINSLESSINIGISKWKEKARESFKRFNHLSAKSFFSTYPIELDELAFFESNIDLVRELVDSFNSNQLVEFAKKYSNQMAKDGPVKDLASSRYLALQLSKYPKPIPLSAVLDAIKQSKTAGLIPKSVPGIKIGFAEVTSKTLLKEGQIEFPAQVDMDLPFDPIKVDIDSIFTGQDNTVADFLIIFDVAKAGTSRRIVTKKDVESKFISGSKSEANPNYEIARGKLYESQAGLARAQSAPSQGLAGVIINGIAIASWRENVKNAESALSSTSSTVTKDVTDDYKYSTSEVKATRTMTTNYYVIDRTGKKYFKGVFDSSESKTFTISYNIHDKDTERQQILAKYDKEDEIARFEKSPMTVTASALINNYLENTASSKPLPPIAKLRQEMLEDKNKALAHFKSQQFDGKPLKDSRFDSVVVILNPKGAIGSGFFVKPTLVLTNYHVVEGVKFVEMKMFNGMETFGKVVKSDIRLDLALIKVQDQGVPVQFYEGNTIDLGATLEAIGHPKGLTFTITRGVASAVRKKQSIYAVGGKEILFVQTDAAINPGNSGGPLFLGQKVVGVNNNKLVGGSEGLGFAVHYSEVAEFMKESF